MDADQASTLTRTVFLFGAMGHGPYGFMTFGTDGTITTYDNPNEAFYRHQDGVLTFLDSNHAPTSALAPLADQPLVFRPHGLGKHYLEPVLSLPPAVTPARPDLPPVLVNTLPKSGTYMVAQALKDAGFAQYGLHLSAAFLHDNRGVPSEEIHWNPNDRALPVPASAAAALLREGEFMVGHIDSPEELRRIQQLGVEVLNVVRSPYSQILSMMKFRLKKVKPTEKDLVWHSMEGAEQLKAFVISHPLDYWLSFSRMLTDNFPYLRFEDLRQGRITEGGTSPELAALLAHGLQTAIGKRTSTLMQETPQEQLDALKDPSIWAYLDSLGMHEYANSIWPDHL